MARKLTRKFPAHIKPVHVGVYKTELRSDVTNLFVEIGYSYWDGENWGNSQRTPEDADAHFKKQGIGVQNKPWWGLTKKPKGDA